MRLRFTKLLGVAVALCVTLAGTASAADLYSSGDKTWNTSSANWGTVFGGPYNTATWNNATPDDAYLEGESGAGGTITLAENISLTNLTFYDNTSADGSQPNERSFTVGGYALNFGAGGFIKAHLTADSRGGSSVTISSDITGSPEVFVGDNNHHIYFTPTNGTVTLGTCNIPYENGVWDKAQLHLGGTTTGNTVTDITYLNSQRWGTVYKEGTGTWTVNGNVLNGGLFIEDGNMYVTGEIDMRYGGLKFNGGVFHYNHAGVMKNGGFQINNGSFDNSSGAAITTSTYNPAQTWGGNWTFIGSGGASSHLYLGNGAVTLSGSRILTVSNSAAALTVGGVVSDGANVYSLTKQGAGKLAFTASNTYDGATYVYDGTLSNAHACLSDSAMLSISNGATLELGYTGTDTVLGIYFDGVMAAAGTWGSPSSGADNTTNVMSGTGILDHNSGVLPAGTWYWDGPNAGGTGDAASDGGGGTWSTSNDNWDQGYVSRKVWNNTTSDKAIFGTSAGTVDLQSDITLGEIVIEKVDNYSIGSNPETQTLDFGGAKSIVVDKVYATIRAGITGSPDVHHYGGFRDELTLDPDSVSMTLGTITIGEDTTSNPKLYLRGTTTNNTATDIQSPHWWTFLEKEDSGTWTLGDVNIYRVDLDDGTLVINGTMDLRNILDFAGGALKGTGTIDGAITVPVGGTLAPGDPTGTLTVTNNNCTINGTLLVEVNGASYGSLSVDPGNTLTISSATLDVNVTSEPSDPIVIASAGTLTGKFASTNNLPARWTVDYYSDRVELTPPPGGTVFLFY